MDEKMISSQERRKKSTKNIKNKIRCLRPGDTRRHTIKGANDKKL